ncbi:TonB-dependent receptor [Lysobacter sp. GX 14042]|nr:TonB-dependent receptor [Lysobacter sp. GX 14042]MCE7031628.1 TonB-dependent receptor [Lysobacter sp. GX 14042]
MSRNHNNQFRRVPLTAAVIACLYAGSAFAQDTTTPAPAEEPQAQQQQSDGDAVQLDKITVTGSLLRRTEYETTSPIQVITADTNISMGQVNAAEFLQKSSVAAGSTQINHQFGGFVVEGGTGVQTLSLRGMGANRTLVLLDGQRPGPAGTRGQVGAFDLNVLPTSIIQRAEIVKDGSSSIYGSDAVAGVVNIITRKSVDRPELTFNMRAPLDGGGEVYSVSGVNGWDFDNGSVVLAGEWYVHEALKLGDRDFLRCGQDMAWDENGNRLDREDRSIIGGTSLGGCSTGNLYANTVMDAVTGDRYVPSPDGVTVGMIPGYRPRYSGRYDTDGAAWYEDQLNFPFSGQENIIDRQEIMSVYAATDFGFDAFNWKTQWLVNRRETESRGFRQFFPLIGGATAVIPAYQYANSPEFSAPVESGIAQPVMPFRSDTDVAVDYFYGATKFDGLFSATDTWAWEVNANYSRSKGEYSNLGIVASRTGDWEYSDTAPTVDYFDPGFLSGERMDELVDAIGEWHTGETVYDQAVLNAFVTGELFQVPAGAVAAALGVEYRRYSIDDQPSSLSTGGDLWGSSSAQQTKGDDSVREIVGEIEIPLLSGMTGFESLTLNGSARVFEYDSIDGSDNVWKLGMNWQINPTLRLRATKGTSFRAPGLYELYLGDQTGFQSQLAVDPCILWGESNNDFIRANCAATGIPEDYPGAASSATVVSGGGAGVLEPETSTAFTAGIVFTPSFAPVSVAVDYFDYEIREQIANLTAGSIISGCYGSAVYPNNFCDLFDRNAADHPTEPFKIEQIRSQYINVNRQKVRGYDLTVNYDEDFSFGRLSVEGQITYTLEDIEELFDSAEASGYTSSDLVGRIGRPELVGALTTSLKRNDLTYMWGVDYVGGTENLDLDPTYTYFGYENAYRDIWAESRLYHSASVRYDRGDWSLLVGMRNIFDKSPAEVSDGVANRYGNIPAFATQYDLYGRTAFARVTYKF